MQFVGQQFLQGVDTAIVGAFDGRQIRLAESDAIRAVRATTCSYREHMGDYAAMRSLNVWYNAIDVDRFIKAVESEERQAKVRERLEKVEETFPSTFRSWPSIAVRLLGSRTIRRSSSIPRPNRRFYASDPVVLVTGGLDLDSIKGVVAAVQSRSDQAISSDNGRHRGFRRPLVQV